MRACFRAILHGDVQGVSLRYFTKHKADGMGIKGTIQNLPDYTVEIFACGEKKVLEKLIGEIKKGSPRARVEKTEIEWLREEKEFKGFSIIY